MLMSCYLVMAAAHFKFEMYSLRYPVCGRRKSWYQQPYYHRDQPHARRQLAVDTHRRKRGPLGSVVGCLCSANKDSAAVESRTAALLVCCCPKRQVTQRVQKNLKGVPRARSGLPRRLLDQRAKQQMQAQQLAHGPGGGLGGPGAGALGPLMGPHALALGPPNSAASLLALSSGLGGSAAAAAAHLAALKDHDKRAAHAVAEDRRNSPSPRDAKSRTRTPDTDLDKKRRKEEKHDHDNDDENQEVDVSNEDPVSPTGATNNGSVSPRENGASDRACIKRERPPSRSGSSSSRSTPVSAKSAKDGLVSPRINSGEKSPTPVSKSLTPTSSGSTTPGSSAGKPPLASSKPASLGPYPYPLHGAPHAALAADLAANPAFSQLHSSALSSYSRSLLSLSQVAGFDSHPSLRPPPHFGAIPGGKP